MQTCSASKGFTLIELLVVISIIGLLASIVLAALGNARSNAKDATLLEEVGQLRAVMELEANSSGGYTNIKLGGGWWAVGQTCTGAAGAYAAEANKICSAMVANAGSCGSGCVWFADLNGPQAYSIMVYLPGKSASAGSAYYFCLGSSGKSSTSPAAVSAGNGTSPGCWANP